MVTTFTNFASITNPAAVQRALLFAAVTVWGLDLGDIDVEVCSVANPRVWAPIACRDIGVLGTSQDALEMHNKPLAELCEHANAVVALLVARHPNAFSWRFEQKINNFCLEWVGRMAA